MPNDTPKSAPSGKIPTAIVVSLFWCLGIGIYLWLQKEKPANPSNPAVAESPASSADATGSNESTHSDSTRRPNHSHYAAELPPPLLITGPIESPPKLAKITPPPANQPVPVIVASGGNYTGTSGSSIRGKIFLHGTPPRELRIRLDEVCGKMHPDGETTHRYVVAKDGGLANVVVYISRGLKGRKFPVPPPVELNQIGCMYEPYVSAAMVGQIVRIKNSDPVLHNVHGLPRENGNNEFNFGQPSQGMVDETTFARKITAKEIMVKIKCDVHDWMLAYVAVLDNPCFAISDTNGNFVIPNVPVGNYTVIATHLKAGSITNRISAVSGQDSTVRFILNAK